MITLIINKKKIRIRRNPTDEDIKNIGELIKNHHQPKRNGREVLLTKFKGKIKRYCFPKGKDNPQWKGGTTPKVVASRHRPDYWRWRRAVLLRDGLKCTKCGSTDKLQATHIKSMRKYPELATVLSNGITLCRDCHFDQHYGG